MRNLVIVLFLSLCTFANAHDGGHGPKITDSPKQGGVMASVIEQDTKKLVYKAELVRTEDAKAKVYVYDINLNPVDLKTFTSSAQAVLEVKKKKKMTKTNFTLNLEGEAFVGILPKITSKPYHVDITFHNNGKSLLVAFEYLD